MRAKLDRRKRRRMVVASLMGKPKRELAEEYGISLQRVYAVVDEDTADPEGYLDLAIEELQYRDYICRLLGKDYEWWLRRDFPWVSRANQ